MICSINKMLKMTLALCMIFGALCCYAKNAEQERRERQAQLLLLLMLQQKQQEQQRRQEFNKSLETLEGLKPCQICDGSGWRDAGRGTRQQCLSCNGTGRRGGK